MGKHSQHRLVGIGEYQLDRAKIPLAIKAPRYLLILLPKDTEHELNISVLYGQYEDIVRALPRNVEVP